MDSPYRVQVIDRALSMLELLGNENRALTLTEFYRRLKLPKSTLLRLLAVLERHGFVVKDARFGSYRLGLKLHELGNKAVAQVDLKERARPHLEKLVAVLQETANLSVLQGDSAIIIDRIEPSRALRVPANIGERFSHSLHASAIGKILLASLPEGDVKEVVGRSRLRAFTGNTITTFPGLLEELKRVRERGYAFDNEEAEAGLICIAAPIRDHSGKVIASIGVSGPTFRLSKRKVPLLSQLVSREATSLSMKLGFGEFRVSSEPSKTEQPPRVYDTRKVGT